MNRLQGLSGLKSLDQYKSSSSGHNFGSTKTFGVPSRSPSDSVSLGSFANLKLTAEKLVKEQASAKTDLELANSKLRKLTEHVHALEEKLQNAFNENAKLKVKQKEDEKLWKGLESKFSSTKTLCDQLTETLQLLAGQVQDAERDKEIFERKTSDTSVALGDLHVKMESLSLRLESSEETIKNREKEVKELIIEKEEKEKQFRDEQYRISSLIEEKDILIKKFEETVVANGLTVENLNSQLKEVLLELQSKEDVLNSLRESKENLEKEKADVMSSNKSFSDKLDRAAREIKKLEDFVNMMGENLAEFDNQHLTFNERIVQLYGLFDSWFKLFQQEKFLVNQHAQLRFNQLHDQFLHATSEKDALQLVNQDLVSKVGELNREQQFTMVQHAEECHLAEERIQKLRAEIESLLSKKTEMQTMITTLEEKTGSLSEALRLSEEKMQSLTLKFSELEVENKDNSGKLLLEIQNKEEEIDVLKKEIRKHEEHVDSMEKQVSQLNSMLEEKEQTVLECKDRETQLEDKKAETQKLLADAESNVLEAKRQYDQMLESKQLELSRHLKEISQRNDQAINDIRRKYEVEKMESINLEKEKAEKNVAEMERKCEQKLADCKEQSKQYMERIQGEHAALITKIQQEHDRKETNLLSNHSDELKSIRLQAENELREKMTALKKEHEAELTDLRCQHEDEYRQLEEELNIQKSKEERQRALLQLQWKVMGDNSQQEQEVTSKKNHSISSTKRSADRVKRSQHAPVRLDDEEMNSPYPKVAQTPVSSLLKKVEKVNAGSVMSIPQHSKKVTHHEYEVETTNGRTVTKRKKTKSTVMFEDPRKQKRGRTPKAKTPTSLMKGISGNPPPKRSNIGGHAPSKSANIGDLFSEGSLNPYADDPYAFD